MDTFIYTLIGNILISFGIILTILFVKFIKNKLVKYLNYIIAITVGLLFGIIFIGFIPELVEEGISGNDLGLFMLFGLGVFYVFELFIHWHHCHDLYNENHNCHQASFHNNKNGLLIFSSTILHNSFHGLVLFGAFGVSVTFGIATTFAILLHSIPQNIVNYIMNHNRERYSYVAAFGGIFGALITYPIINILIQNKSNILAFITGCLLYTALADIFPEFKKNKNLKFKIIYLVFIVLGICLFKAFENII